MAVSTNQPPHLSRSKIFLLLPHETIKQFSLFLHALSLWQPLTYILTSVSWPVPGISYQWNYAACDI